MFLDGGLDPGEVFLVPRIHFDDLLIFRKLMVIIKIKKILAAFARVNSFMGVSPNNRVLGGWIAGSRALFLNTSSSFNHQSVEANLHTDTQKSHILTSLIKFVATEEFLDASTFCTKIFLSTLSYVCVTVINYSCYYGHFKP